MDVFRAFLIVMIGELEAYLPEDRVGLWRSYMNISIGQIRSGDEPHLG